MSRFRRFFDDFDWHLLAVALLLTFLGLGFVWSTTHEGSEGMGLLLRQGLYVVCVLPMVFVVVRMSTYLLTKAAPLFYAAVVALLIFQMVGGGDEVRSTQSWIRLPFGFTFQPSEFAKPAIILIVAAFLRHRSRPRSWAGLVGPVALAFFPVLLVAQQPDLGSAVTMVPVLFVMLFVAGARNRQLLVVLAGGAGVAVLLFFSPLVHDYQRIRVESFLLDSIPAQSEEVTRLRAEGKHDEAGEAARDLRSMKQGTNFQVYHAMISIGSGGMWGKGIGEGPHNRLDYLPERHNDFIFAVVGEELGFVGASVVLLLELLMVFLILGIARRTRDSFGRLICVGVAAQFGFQVLLNTGVATGLLPVTGVTLPFLSFGGSSLVACYLSLAMVLRVGVHRVPVLDGETFNQVAFGESREV